MDYTEDDCRRETSEHIESVFKLLDKIICKLSLRGIQHDASKMQEPEIKIFTEFTPLLKTVNYGTPEYKEFLEGMDVALKHHYESNRHHPEHFENGISGMNLVDIIEMFCDWTAATKRMKDGGDIHRSIEVNRARFSIPEELCAIFENTVDMLQD